MKKLSPLIILFLSLNLFSQKEANFWYFGRNAALDFNSGAPIPVSGSKLNTVEGCSSFSDANGNLLFYVGAPNDDARELTVWDKNNNPMPNGTGLQGDSSSAQSALTIPHPNNPDIYYLFTVGTTATGGSSGGTAGFFLYEINMSLNGGNGDIDITKGDATGAINLSDGKDIDWTEKVTAVRAKDCNTFWVISLSETTSINGNNEFYAYKVSDAGVDTTNPVISEVPGLRTSDVRGYLKVSPDGTKLVAASISNGTFIFDFNNETGEVTNFKNSTSINQLNINNGYGVEFSTSSDRLYISTGESSSGTQENLYQFNLNLSTFSEINNSRFLVYNYFNTRGALQLGPDGKIYWSSDGSNNISVINSPNLLGAAVNYSHQSVNLGLGITASQGLPPFLSSLLLPIEIKDKSTNQIINNQNLQFCVGESKTIEPEAVSGSNITYEWSLNNGTTTTTIATTKNLPLLNLTKANNGTYTLKVELTDDCGNTTSYDGTFSIEVFETASAKQDIKDILFCDDDLSIPNSFDLSALKNTEILDGLDSVIFDVLYFDTLDKANDNLAGTNLPSPYLINTVGKQTIYARVNNKNAPNACYAITNFDIQITSTPIATQPTDYNLCDDDTDGIINNIDFSGKDLEVLNTLSNTQYNVIYYTTQIGAETNDALTIIDKENHAVTNSQRIYIRVENKDNTACYIVSNDANGSLFKSFNIIIDPKPIVLNAVVELFQCDNDADKQTTFNLTEAEISISKDIDHTFKYFKTKTEAENGTPEIADKTSYFVNTNGEAWVRTTSTNTTCYTISKINLTVSYTPNQTFGDTFYECDDFLDDQGNNTVNNDDSDGITSFDLSTAPNLITTDSDKKVEFYETDSDRTKSINEITETQSLSNYRNKNTPYTGAPLTIFYKIISITNNNCQGIGQFYLEVNEIPNFTVNGEDAENPIIICTYNIPYTLQVTTTGNYNYIWTKDGASFGRDTKTLEINEPGVYTVTALSKDPSICSRVKTITVLKSNFETLKDNYITIKDDTSGISSNLSIQIDIPTTPLINETFKYALENENGTIIHSLQDSNIFNDIEGGIYKVIVENNDGCGASELTVSVLQFPKYFTPSGNTNSTWVVKGANNAFYQSNSTINIFNRYGKLIAQTTIDGNGWDGTYNGKTLPSDDYWFSVQLIPIDTNKMPILKKGHFSLLRK